MSEFVITDMLRAIHPIYDMIVQKGEICMLPKIELGDQQLMVIEDFYKWYQQCDPTKPDTMIYKLSGWAGTGKTTIVPFLKFRIGSDKSWVFATLTGKAAGVLRTKGLNASTIHSSLYKYTDDIEVAEPGIKKHISLLEELRDSVTDKETLFIINQSLKEKQDLLKDIYSPNPKNKSWYTLNPESSFFTTDVICIDESSMIDKIMEVDILLAGKPIFFIGDNGQLPPISKFSSVFFDRQGNILPVNFQLTEIHRQAAENPIIQLSMDIRNGRYPKRGRYGDKVLVTSYDKINDEIIAKADICVCGTNNFRRDINQIVREVRGYNSALPVAGDDLIFKVNNHGKDVFNGMTFKAESDAQQINMDTYLLDFTREDNIMMEGEEFSAQFTLGTLDKNNIPPKMFRAKLFADYGYGITAHSSQGSTYNKGIMFGVDCPSRTDRDRRRWWYTSITRFADKVVVGI